MNFFRSKVNTVDDKDLAWTDEEIKYKVKSKKKKFQQYLKNARKIIHFEIVDKEASELSEIIQNQKEKYFYDRSLKLNNPQNCLKRYWSVIKQVTMVEKSQ